MKELAIAVMAAVHKEFLFAFDLHDGLFYYLEADDFEAAKQKTLQARGTLNNLPYQSAWGWTPTIKFPWDASIGTDWGHMQELKS